MKANFTFPIERPSCSFKGMEFNKLYTCPNRNGECLFVKIAEPSPEHAGIARLLCITAKGIVIVSEEHPQDKFYEYGGSVTLS